MPTTKPLVSSVPMPFPGTPDEVAVNRETHDFDWEWMRCMGCDCRPLSVSSEWPCGSVVPRKEFVR